MLDTTFSVPFTQEGRWEVVVLNKRPIQCHSSLLSSLGLTPQRRGKDTDTDPLRIEVDDEVFVYFKEFLHTGFLSVTEENIGSLMYAANKFGIHILRQFCEKMYLTQLSPSTCLKLWLIGDNYGCRDLETEALNMVQEHFEDISRSDCICHIDKHHMKELLQNRHIHVTSFECVYQAIKRWSKYDRGFRLEAKEELTEVLFDIMNKYGANGFYSSLRRATNMAPSAGPEQSPHADLFYRNNSANGMYHGGRRTLKQDSSYHLELEQASRRNHPEVPILCVGEDPVDGLGLFQVTSNDGSLRVSRLQLTLPAEVDVESSFCYCQQTGYCYISEGKRVWTFALGKTGWTQLEKMPFPRSRHVVCRSLGKTFVLGGYDSVQLRPTEHVFSYNSRRKSWTDKHGKEKMKLCKRAVFCKSASIGPVVYLFGNRRVDTDGNICTPASASSYDTTSWDKSRSISIPPFVEQGACIAHVLASTDGFLYVLSSKGDVLRYVPQDDTYEVLPPVPISRSSSGCCLRSGVLFVYGGLRSPTDCSDSGIPSYCLNLHEKNAQWLACGHLKSSIRILS